jgi:hypothetical protein
MSRKKKKLTTDDIKKIIDQSELTKDDLELEQEEYVITDPIDPDHFQLQINNGENYE